MEDLLLNTLAKIADPILTLLLIGGAITIWVLYKHNGNKQKNIDKLQEIKDKETKDMNQILLQVRESDITVIAELKNTLNKFIEKEEDSTESNKSINEVLKRNNELLMQLLVKVEFLISKYSLNG